MVVTINQIIKHLYYNNDVIKTNDVVMNKTRSYLVQSLQHYGEQFVENISNNRVISFTIGDYGSGSKKLEPYIYMLFDVNGIKKFGHYIGINKGRYVFQKSLNYYQQHESYVTDYCFDSNKTGHLHVIVVKLPFPEKFNLFLNGEYSKLYTQQEIDKWFIKDIQVNIIEKGKKKVHHERNEQYEVLTHSKDFFPIFKDKVFEEFGTILTEEDIQMEYDFKPRLNKEILRYE